MGRKGNFVDKSPRGPGRKAKKQKPPTLAAHLVEGSFLKFVLFQFNENTINNFFFNTQKKKKNNRWVGDLRNELLNAVP